MPAGRTNQPLNIWVAEQWAQHDAVTALAKAGHYIVPVRPGMGYYAEPDLILHPAAHGWNDMMWDYLPAALTAARRRKKEGKK
jgi:hypothetical protein